MPWQYLLKLESPIREKIVDVESGINGIYY